MQGMRIFAAVLWSNNLLAIIPHEAALCCNPIGLVSHIISASPDWQPAHRTQNFNCAKKRLRVYSCSSTFSYSWLPWWLPWSRATLLLQIICIYCLFDQTVQIWWKRGKKLNERWFNTQLGISHNTFNFSIKTKYQEIQRITQQNTNYIINCIGAKQ